MQETPSDTPATTSSLETVLELGGATFAISESGLATTYYPDTPPIMAYHERNEEYLARAESLGYGKDTLKMCHEHEATHHLLTELLGLPCSPALYEHAHGKKKSKLAGAEECAILAIQRYARLAGIDLLEVAKLWARQNH